MRKRRMAWLDLQEAQPGVEGVPASGKAPMRLRLIRPSEEDMGRGIVMAGSVSIGFEDVKRFVVDWSGFTQADLLGSAIGSNDPVAFHPELWAEYVADNTDVYQRVAKRLVEMCVAHIRSKAEDRKN